MMEVREELWKILSDDQAKRLPCLIYANKQDLPGAISSEQLVNELDLMKDNTMHNSNSLIHVQSCSCKGGADGLTEGF